MDVKTGDGLIFRMLCILTVFMLFFPVVSRSESQQVLTIGSKGEQVLQMSRKLRDLRYLDKKSVGRKYTEKIAEAVSYFQRLNGLPETGDADLMTIQVLLDEAAVPAPWPTLVPLTTPEPPAEPDWPERDEAGYLAVEGEYYYENEDEGQWHYLSANLQITIHKYRDSSVPLEWYETEVYCRNGERFRTVMTDPDRPSTKYRYPYDIAQSAGFVLGFSDDFYANRVAEKEKIGIIIREGKIIYHNTHTKANHYLPNLDLMAQFPDGRLEVYECNEITGEELLEQNAINVFSFGPILIRNGEINELLYTYYRSKEPRQALGMIEPDHYLLVSVLGRTQGSSGTMLQRVAEIMKAKGVKNALNLDGGNTLALVFHGRILNRKATYKNRTFYRTVTSLIGIGHTETGDE